MKKRLFCFRGPDDLLADAKRLADLEETTVTELIVEGLHKEILCRKLNKTQGKDSELTKFVDRARTMGLALAISNLPSVYTLSPPPLACAGKNKRRIREEEEKNKKEVCILDNTPKGVLLKVRSDEENPAKSPGGGPEAEPPKPKPGQLMRYKKKTKSTYFKDYNSTSVAPEEMTLELLYGKFLQVAKQHSGSYGGGRVESDLETIKWMLSEYPRWFSDDMEENPKVTPSLLLYNLFDNLLKLPKNIRFTLFNLRKRSWLVSWAMDHDLMRSTKETDEEWG